jgi:hypothetical protein
VEDELQALPEQEDPAAAEKRLKVLETLAQSIAARRSEAIMGRASSGIEKEWEGDEEFYIGIDDANRHEYAELAQKPTAGGGTAKLPRKRNKSTIFPNITQPYVDAAAARIGDMLLPTDDRNFALRPTPIPELAVPQAPAPQPPAPMGAAAPLMPAMAGGAAPPPQITLPDGSVVDHTGAAKALEELKKQAKEKAEAAELWIDDRLIECQWHAEVRKVIDDCARIGSGVLKGPFPVKKTVKAWISEGGMSRLDMKDLIKPGSKRVDPWNLFPDPNCGETLHDGSYVFERDYMGEQKVQALKGLPGYIDSQLDKVIEEGPAKYVASGKVAWSERSNEKKGRFEIWYYHGIVKAEEMTAALECSGYSETDEDGNQSDAWREELKEGESIDVMLTLINDQIVRASFNPLDSGAFPYDIIPWKRRPNMPWGIGVARQMRTPQRIVVGASRYLMDNAGLAGGPQIIMRKGLKPVDGKREVVPLKFWYADEDSEGRPAGDFMKSVEIPMQEGSLMNIVQFGMKMAEDVTGLPMLLQGQQGKAPDTVGGMTILNNNGTAVLRRIARLFDSCITEPHIGRYYDWLMAHEEDESLKGDYLIDARGSSALVERDLQNQEMPQILQMCLNPLFEKSPKRAMDEYLKSRRFDPKMFDLTDEEKAEIANRPQPEDPRIAAAKIASKTQYEIAGMKDATEQKKIDVQSADNQMDAKVALEKINADMDKAMTGDATTRETNLAQIKKDLSSLVIKLQAQDRQNRQLVTPPTEPAGTAPAGQAYEK